MALGPANDEGGTESGALNAGHENPDGLGNPADGHRDSQRQQQTGTSQQGEIEEWKLD